MINRSKRQTKSRDRDGLNLREALFCRLYIIEKGNGKAAAEGAGYSGKHVRTVASHLLDNPKIAAVIQREGAKLVQKLEVKAERVLMELCKVAFADVRRMFRPDSTMIPIALMDETSAALISAVVVRKGGLRVRFYNKLQALDLLGRHLKLWDGSGDGAVDRLTEVLAAFREGPIEIKKDDEPKTIQ